MCARGLCVCTCVCEGGSRLLTPLRTSSCVQEQMVRGGSVGTCIYKRANAVRSPPDPHRGVGETPHSPVWGPPQPGAAGREWRDPHPQRPVGGGGVEGPQRVPEPRDLQPVPHVEILREERHENTLRGTGGHPVPPPRPPNSPRGPYPGGLEAAGAVPEDVHSALVVPGPELRPPVRHREQVVFQLGRESRGALGCRGGGTEPQGPPQQVWGVSGTHLQPLEDPVGPSVEDDEGPVLAARHDEPVVGCQGQDGAGMGLVAAHQGLTGCRRKGVQPGGSPPAIPPPLPSPPGTPHPKARPTSRVVDCHRLVVSAGDEDVGAVGEAQHGRLLPGGEGRVGISRGTS